MDVGVIGLGKMGSAIASNLLARGYAVSVWNRSPGPVQALLPDGGTASPSIPALVERVEAAIVMLWGDDAQRSVVASRPSRLRFSGARTPRAKGR